MSLSQVFVLVSQVLVLVGLVLVFAQPVLVNITGLTSVLLLLHAPDEDNNGVLSEPQKEELAKEVNSYHYLLSVGISSLRHTVESLVYHNGRNKCSDDAVSSTSHWTRLPGDQLNTYTALQIISNKHIQ